MAPSDEEILRRQQRLPHFALECHRINARHADTPGIEVEEKDGGSALVEATRSGRSENASSEIEAFYPPPGGLFAMLEIICKH